MTDLIEVVPVKQKVVDVNKARQVIQGFGYSVGYLQTATFIVIEPDTKDMPRHVVVSVYELGKLAGAEDVVAFKRMLDEIALTPIDRAYPRNQA